jgi:hypothetical protein
MLSSAAKEEGIWLIGGHTSLKRVTREWKVYILFDRLDTRERCGDEQDL